MNNYQDKFKVPERILLGAGPSGVNPRVLSAMGMPLLGHLDPEFLELMDRVRDMLRWVFNTNNGVTLPISGTGSAGMEAALVNTLEPGDTIIIGINGFFGDRMAAIASRCGANVRRVESPWDKPLDPQEIEIELKNNSKVKAVAFVHAETSTGVINTVPEIANIAHAYGALVIVDAVTSLGGIEVAVDDWGVDVCYSGTQKCLGCPPGLSPITFGPSGQYAFEQRQTQVQSWYFDMNLLYTYWSTDRAYHHTAPISMIYGLAEGLRVVFEEGLSARFERHARNARSLHAGLEAMGLRLFAQEGARLPTLTSVYVPTGIDDNKVRSVLLDKYKIQISGGLGPVAGKIWRIGLMGENSTGANVMKFLSALEEILAEEGYKVHKGEGTTAAQKLLT